MGDGHTVGDHQISQHDIYVDNPTVCVKIGRVFRVTGLRTILVGCVADEQRPTLVNTSRVFGVSRQTVHRWLSANEIPASVAIRILQLRDGEINLADIAPFVLELDG